MNNGKESIFDIANKLTVDTVSAKRNGRGKKSYLDRFVDALLNDDGEPTEPKTRSEVITEVSLSACYDEYGEDFDLNNVEYVKLYKEMVVKVRNHVYAAVANNSNGMSLSYNKKYKDIWEVVKHDNKKISLAPKQ